MSILCANCSAFCTTLRLQTYEASADNSITSFLVHPKGAGAVICSPFYFISDLFRYNVNYYTIGRYELKISDFLTAFSPIDMITKYEICGDTPEHF